MFGSHSGASNPDRICNQPIAAHVNKKGESSTRWVMGLTFVTMIAEIVAGSWYGSMALLADGWHMGTHVAAFAITLFAYHYARKHSDNKAFSFGTGKVTLLGGFASAVALGVVALMMVIESVERLFSPQAIGFEESIAVAVLGLTVNLASAWLLKDHHHHHGHSHHHSTSHGHSHGDAHSHSHHADDHSHNHAAGHSHQHSSDHIHSSDHNLKAAYLHVLADALTSVLAIIALLAAMYFGWLWLDALMGIVGAAIISVWALGLMKESSALLLDSGVPAELERAIHRILESGQINIQDLHTWPVSEHKFALVLSISGSKPEQVKALREQLSELSSLDHVTIESID